jgi:hypothetical protein
MENEVRATAPEPRLTNDGEEDITQGVKEIL